MKKKLTESYRVSWFCAVLGAVFLSGTLNSAKAEMKKEGIPETVSYHEHVRPIFQAKCQGCHQPAKNKAGYVMTEVARLIAGGDSGEAVLPGKPAESHLMELITKQEGEERPEMPPKEEPLSDYERSIVSKWIAQGAQDDTPENARQKYSAENPPVYAVAPMATSLDFSPDGNLLAVSGFHEVLLHQADGSGMVARLVGLSERIESVQFSPDGKLLAVAGGLPGRMGEIQVWDVAKRELKLSKPVGFDTAYGASWSPDSQFIAFGLPDNTVRAIKASNGEQILFMGTHNDWVLDTDWGIKGEHLVSVGRDMTTKLTEVKTERFIDNLTSITPGALKGGVNAIARHPSQNHVLVGGSDGVPQIYRMKRETVRKIGDNANLIRKYPAMKGRIWDVAFRPDGKQFAAVSSLNGKGQINIYKSEYDATITPELKKLFETVRRSPNSAENKEDKIEEFHTKGAELIKSIDTGAAVFSIAYSPDGKTIAAGTEDGTIRLLNSGDLSTRLAFLPVAVDTELAGLPIDRKAVNLKKGKVHPIKEQLPKGAKIVGLAISPAHIRLDSANDYTQLLVTAKLDTGDQADLTRLVKWKSDSEILSISDRGIAQAKKDGEFTLTATYGEGIQATATVKTSLGGGDFHPDFIRDVNPVISRLGCNMGTCHGAKDGKNGFKLSLRGYDPLFDVRAFGDDHAGRRVNYASPDDSLMLLKATGAVPHEGGVITEYGSDYYRVIRSWISQGARLETGTPKVTSIEVFPKNPVIQNIGAKQQIRVVANWADGQRRDVTREAYIESGNTDVAAHDDSGLVATIRRGEAPILARYEGAYAATTLTVMGDREGFTWSEPETWGEIDKLVAAKWQRMKLQPSELCSDEEFVRRIHLDLTGLPPSSDRTRKFIANDTPTREKRSQLVDELIGSPAFVDHWTNKWSDMLQVNSKFLGGEGARLFRDWIRKQVESNVPYDEFVYKVLTASGSNKENPAASYYKILREPDMLMENTTHLFLSTRFNCNKCHDHPFERWTQDQYYETAAYFAQVKLDRDPKNAPKQNIGGSAVEGAKPLYEVISDKPDGDITHDRTGEVQAPSFPYEAKLAQVKFSEPEKPSRREQLAAWITSPENQYFASSYANRIWGYLLGTGIIEPLDDIRAGNPPSNPQLLDYLSKHFIGTGFNVRELMREICNSRTYQLSISTNKWNEGDEVNFSHGKARRLPAEVLYDAVYFVTGAVPDIPGAGKGVRASQLPDAKLDLKSGFLANLGRPVRESACECERSADMQMSAVMAFLSGPAIADAVGAKESELASLVESQPDDRKLVEEVYYRVLARAPQATEIDAALASFKEIGSDHATLVQRVAKAEAAWVSKGSELEIARLQNISQEKNKLDAYMPTHEANKKKAEAEQKVRVANAEKALLERKNQLPKVTEEFAANIKASQLYTKWKVLPVTTAAASDKSKVEKLPDGSIRADAKNNKPRNLDYTIVSDLKEENITGLMIESVPDETFPGLGAGFLSGDGNFVITELQASWHTDPKKPMPLAFSDAKAEFTQNGFDVKNTFNGKLDRNDKGWALAGSNQKKRHRAVFKFKETMKGDPKGAKLELKVLNRYNPGAYPIGRFRVWYTTDVDPLNYGLPAGVSQAITLAPAARSDEQKQQLASYVTDNDEDYQNKRMELARQKRPLPGDQKLTQLQAAVKTAELPVKEPLPLVQLRQDITYSIEQSANRRLTAAQDLAWALINSPSFLFNR